MAEPKEIGTVWTLGCEVFVEDALTADVQEIKVNDIVLSANIFTEGLSVEVGSDKVNAMDLDVRISMDGLKTYIIDSQIVPYEEVLKITDFSPEATNEKRYASSANTSKKIIDSVGELEGRVNVAEGDIDALGKRVDDLELKGTGGSGDGFWYLNEQDGKIHTDHGIVVHGDAIVEGDTSSGGSGEDVVVGIQGVRVNGTTHYDEDGDGVVDLGTIESGGGLTSVSWGDIQGTPPSVSTFNNDVPYVTDEELKPLGEEIELLSSMWHLDENGNLVTDKQVLIKNNLIIEGDTSSGGEGEDTPSGGISGVKVNGVTYYDDNGDGVIDLGTISGGGGTADLSNYYTKAESDARYLALSGGTIASSSTDTPLTIKNNNASGAWIGFNNASGNLGYVGYTYEKKLHCYDENGVARIVVHSNNIGSYAMKWMGPGGGRDLNTFSYDAGVFGASSATNAPSGLFAYAVLNLPYRRVAEKTDFMAQILIPNGDETDTNMYFRTSLADSWNPWRKVISTDDDGYIYGLGGYIDIQYADEINRYGGNLHLQHRGGVGATGSGTGGTTTGHILMCAYGGNVLIGTATDDASHKVQVDGALKVYETSQRRLYTRINSAGVQCGVNTSLYTGGWNGGVTVGADNSSIGYVAGAYLEGGTLFKIFYGGTSFSNASIVIDGFSGHVGIGATTPVEKLDVNGNIQVGASMLLYSGTSNPYIRFKLNGNIWYCQAYTTNGTDGIFLGSTSSKSLKVDASGNVYCPQNLIVSGDTSSGSDIRFKDVIKNKIIKIEHIAKAPLFTFKWNDREDDSVHLGSSAQYWENIAPWLVKGEDFKTLDYSTLGVAMGISLAKKAVNHEERIKALEKEIKRLKEEMIHG